jgi:hypothetical protein
MNVEKILDWVQVQGDGIIQLANKSVAEQLAAYDKVGTGVGFILVLNQMIMETANTETGVQSHPLFGTDPKSDCQQSQSCSDDCCDSGRANCCGGDGCCGDEPAVVRELQSVPVVKLHNDWYKPKNENLTDILAAVIRSFTQQDRL